MKKVKLDILGLSSSQSQRGSYALILGEQEGNRRFPIIIAMPEAQAISVELQSIHSDRPFTHDLFKSFAESFHFDVIEVIVSNLKDGIFFGEIVCIDKRSGKRITIDARSSDAIAIGLRFKVQIYTYEFIMQEAAIALDDIEDEDEVSSEGTTSPTEENSEDSAQESKKKEEDESEEFKKLTLAKLEEILKKTLEEENYERAVLIRDEIESRKK